ncbi:hypothetical protein G1K75_07790 [Tenacibaculum finnmarkense]|uniref:hypothetical protein n=1 Tax=Tenacibaculum TaxID=104267 RepID=UPI00187BB6E8|nr:MULTISPECIES: hypothetical protein [Tenacibaculum]MBE7692965.1 hypothetical protein [Tenacibaculum finnmarkense genomovar finnmarkense]MCG8805558.1 hypothetical protein [Tenacibaculum finnmarkense]MCG8856801.1 hypothetical protein [Tenacibaculum finnmarkense]WBX74025.1 hypothetical protein PG913_01920 [Tenacibaculum pacificus]
MSTLNLVEEALDFEKNHKSFRTRNEKIVASRKAKEIVLAINEIYKKSRDKKLMDIMKRITLIKQKIEKRLKGRL